MLIYTSDVLDDCLRGGFRARSKEQGLGPCREGVRGFKSHLPHHHVQESTRQDDADTEFSGTYRKPRGSLLLAKKEDVFPKALNFLTNVLS